jgi:uncharacterized protein (TIGR01777 family)
MKYMIAGATGFIGQQFVQRWLAQGHDIIVIGRSLAKINQIFGGRVTAVTWSNLTSESLIGCDAVINLAGAGIGDKRWTAARQQEILTSRIQATEKLAQLCARLGPQSPALFNASAIGVYGLQAALPDQLPAPYDEDTVINFQQAPDFLAQVARAWELAAKPAEAAGVRVVYLRFGVVLAKQGGALPRMALPFKFGLGGRIGSGQQPFSWIALPDLIAIIELLLADKTITGPINITAPQCVTQKQFADQLGRALHKPSIIPTPAIALKLLFGRMAEELLLSGQHVVPKRLLALGYSFQYPTLEQVLTMIYANH